MKKLKLFVPITKVEKTADDTRMVYGVLALEEVDKDNEIMDYAESKKFFEAWNSNYREKTKAMGVEESVGNLRAMHKSISAGAFREMGYDDDAKTITVAAEVVDKDEVQKVDKGVYTGFSIGARRVKAAFDKAVNALRWVADPYEGSIVDNPCMYSAAIQAVKAAKSDNAEFVKFAGKSSEKTAKIEKGLYTVCRMADLLQSLMWLAGDVELEAQYEGDGSPIPAELKAQCKALAESLKKYTVEEADEAIADLEGLAQVEVVEMADKPKAAKVAEPGERPKEKAASAPLEPGVKPTEKTETPAASAPAPVTATETEKAKTPKKSELLAALEGIKQQIEALNGEEEAVSSETPAAPDPAKAAGAAPASDVVTKAQFDAVKSENDALKAEQAETKKHLDEIEKLLKRPIGTAAKLKGAIVVDKTEDEAAVEKTAADERKAAEKVAKETGDISGVIKNIHANGPTQRR